MTTAGTRARAPRTGYWRDRSRKERERVEIVAWDGEGTAVADGEPQPYVLLMNSAQEEYYAPEGLRTVTVFRALLKTALEHPHALHFIYGGSYDVNMWIKDLPESALRRLWVDGTVLWNDYRIIYRPRKMFYLKHMTSNVSLTVWDCFPWCQRSFIAALAEYLGRDYVDYQLIADGKARRSTFDESERDYIRQYTAAELRALVLLVQSLMRRLHDAGIYVSRWDGPGAAAAALLRDNGMKQWEAETPDGVKYAAAVAYSGGRIELLQYGNYEGTIYHYDIHSAYPAAMVTLPALAGGQWQHIRGDAPVQDCALYRLKWTTPQLHNAKPFYPFPFRTEDGSIYYPPEGESWVWGPEYAAYLANHAWFGINVQCAEAYVFHERDTTNRPFTWVHQLYTLRQQWKREGNAAEWALKLGLNSLYGKLAQTVGWSDTRKPPFYQLEWAGLITSYTRAALLRAAMTNPESCVMFATDGLFATAPLDVREGEDLGEWESLTHEGLTAVQSGVYFINERGNWRTWSRGYNAEELKRDEILEAWKLRTLRMQIPQTRFLTIGSALAGKAVSGAWRSWRTAPRDLYLGATGKRAEVKTTRKLTPHTSLVRTTPAYIFDGANGGASAPYNRAWKETAQGKQDGVPLLVFETEVAEAGL